MRFRVVVPRPGKPAARFYVRAENIGVATEMARDILKPQFPFTIGDAAKRSTPTLDADEWRFLSHLHSNTYNAVEALDSHEKNVLTTLCLYGLAVKDPKTDRFRVTGAGHRHYEARLAEIRTQNEREGRHR